jgi:hypothetical protein
MSGDLRSRISAGDGPAVAFARMKWVSRRLRACRTGSVATVLAQPAGTDLLAVDGSMFTAWQLTGSPERWPQEQAIKVPIQYGSSSGN